MSFYEEMQQYSWIDIGKDLESASRSEVESALSARRMTLEGFLSLLSPAAEPFLEEMAQRAHQMTQQRFGKVIGLFAPLYLSNECTNSCAYCGFNAHNSIHRLTLTMEQAEGEAIHLHQLGFRHLLLVSGEAPHLVSLDYLHGVVQRLRDRFPSISIEIYPLETDEYRVLYEGGVDGLVVYQETYNPERYAQVHPAGKKRDYCRRLGTAERGGEAGFRRIGLGALLGLDDWRIEGFFLALHASYLLRTYWRSHVTVSFPRLRPAAGSYCPPFPVTDVHLVQLLTALRLFLPDVGFTLSTRESPFLRDHLIALGITSMSAGSRTDPGGYTHATQAEAQFTVADERSPEAVCNVIRLKGYEPVWKDWDGAFLG